MKNKTTKSQWYQFFKETEKLRKEKNQQDKMSVCEIDVFDVSLSSNS